MAFLLGICVVMSYFIRFYWAFIDRTRSDTICDFTEPF